MWIFPGLSLITIAVGQLCKTKCSFIEGDILGIDLNIVGAVFYAMLFSSALFYRANQREWLIKAICAAASVGIGAEILFIKFQIENDTYCPKCLISGFFFILMFLLVSPQLKKWVIALLIALGVFFTALTFNGSVVPTYASDSYPYFGNGKAGTEVIIYSDYFCPACMAVDQRINGVLRKTGDRIKIRFIDVPVHAGSLEYAELFLYSWFQEGGNLEKAIRAREILFDSAKAKATPSEAISRLKKSGLDPRPDRQRAHEIFRNFYNGAIKQDKVNATPTVVVVKGTERKKYVGGKEISTALEEIAAGP